MRKTIFCCLIMVVLLFSIAIKKVTFSYNSNIVLGDTYIKGDVNDDGKISLGDYLLVKKHILNISVLSGEGLTRADANSDSKVTSADYIKIKKIIMGLDIPVTVSDSTVTDIKLNKSSVDLGIGDTYQFTYTISPSTATNKNVTCTSSNTSIVSVQNTKITALKTGTASITCKCQDKSAKMTVTVSDNTVIDIKLSKSTLDLELGKTAKLTYTINPTNATTGEVKCSSSNTSVMSVKNYVITANKKGTATITCQYRGKKAKMTVNVYEYFDIGLFWGQSNMVGRNGMYAEEKTTNNVSALKNIDADILKNTKSYARVNLNMTKKVAYEYKYSANKLYDISNNPNTFGEILYYNDGKLSSTKDNGVNIQKSSGTNMIPYFAKEYYEQTKHKLIVVFAASGGQTINKFLPNSTTNLYKIMTTKFKKAEKYILSQNKYYRIRNKFYVVYQGESDCTKDLAPNYERDYLIVHNNLVKDLSLSFGAMVYIAPGKSTISMSNAYVQKVRQQEKKLVKEHDNIIMGSDFPYSQLSTSNRSVLCPGDNEIHYNAAALSQIGREVAKSIAKSGKLK